MTTGPVFTLANQLTLLRMLLIPAFVLLVVYGRFGWALLVFIVAGLTDALDGLIARMTGPEERARRVAGSCRRQAAAGDHLHRPHAAQHRAGQPHPDLADRPHDQPRRRHRPDGGDREPGVGAADVPAVAAGQGGDRLVHPHLRRGDVLQLAGGAASPVVDVFIWTSLAITLASGIDYVWRIGRLLGSRPSPRATIWRSRHSAHQSPHGRLSHRSGSATAPFRGSSRWSCPGLLRATPSVPNRAACGRA